jgi:hypothetical protein
MAAVEWIASMREVMRLQSSDTGNLLVIRYEDLVASPTNTMQEILRFSALPHDQVVLEYAAKTLVQKNTHSPLHLHPAIQPTFDATMEVLGYQRQQAA